MQAVKILLPPLVLASAVAAGPLTYGMCQAVCSNWLINCYAEAGYSINTGVGFTFNTLVITSATPVAITTCNSAYAACQVGCRVALHDSNL